MVFYHAILREEHQRGSSFLGLILIAVGVMVDTKTSLVSSCGHCGNEVAHSSVLCPACRADLAPEP